MEDFLNYLNVRQLIFNKGLNPDDDDDVKDMIVEQFQETEHFTDSDLDDIVGFYRLYEEKQPGAIYLTDNLIWMFHRAAQH